MALTSTFGTAVVTISGTAETIVASTPFLQFVPVGAPTTYAGMAIRGNVAFTAGTTVTQVSARVRQGTALTGALVGGVSIPIITTTATAVGNPYVFAFEVLDAAASPATQYTVSLVQNQATNGTVTTFEIETDPVIP